VPENVLHHTSGDSDFFVRWDVFEFSGDFIFSFLADGAGIEDDDISFFFCFTIRKSAVEEDGFDSGGVGVVHLASEGDDVEFHGRDSRKKDKGQRFCVTEGKIYAASIGIWRLDSKEKYQVYTLILC